MMTNQNPWIAAVNDALTRLAAKPCALFVALLCINALAQPYAGISHDARLYSVQVLNRVESGAYADDIFFRYGSQDDYSLFSRLAAPLVTMLGLPAAFFVIYLLSKSLLIFGMMRLVQTLIPNRAAGALALFFCVACPVHFGGHHMLLVQENFVTPRLLACALVLIGLDLLLHGRPMFSGLAIAFAVTIHPLMAFGGLLVWAGFHVWKYLGVKTFIAAMIAAGGLASVVLFNESLGKRLLGAMDDDWRQEIMRASPFNFPSLWDWTDWLGLAFQLAIVSIVIAKIRTAQTDKARFLAVLMLVTVAGAVGAILAEQLPYAVFLQGQPYRALWMLAFLHLAFVVGLMVEWSEPDAQARESAPSLACASGSCALLAYLCCVNAMAEEWMLPLLLFPLVAVVLRGLEKEPHRPAWLVQSIQVSVVLGALGWAGYKVFLLLRGYDDLLQRHHEHRDLVEVVIRNMGPIVFCVAACWILVQVIRTRWSRPAIIAASGAACLALQTFYFAFPETDYYRERFTHYRADLRAVHAMLHQNRSADDRLPTVYCNLGCLDYVWLDLHSKSYFDWWQAGNFMFRREMAMEGRRRAALVGPCAIAHYRQYEDQLSPGYKATIGRFYHTDFQREPLNKDDLAKLCQEPGLDYLVLDQAVDGVASAQVGRLHVVSCSDVRIATRGDRSSLASTR